VQRRREEGREKRRQEIEQKIKMKEERVERREEREKIHKRQKLFIVILSHLKVRSSYFFI